MPAGHDTPTNTVSEWNGGLAVAERSFDADLASDGADPAANDWFGFRPAPRQLRESALCRIVLRAGSVRPASDLLHTS